VSCRTGLPILCHNVDLSAILRSASTDRTPVKGRPHGQNDRRALDALPNILATVRPCVAIISAGEDPMATRGSHVVDRPEDPGLRACAPICDDAFRVQTDGDHLHIMCFVPCSERLSNYLRQAQAPNYQQNAQQQQKSDRSPVFTILLVLRKGECAGTVRKIRGH
jgi:hypothetical protein